MDIDSLRIKRFCELTGWSIRAVQTKVDRGIWLMGRECKKAPDGSIIISITGYEKWVNANTKKIPDSVK